MPTELPPRRVTPPESTREGRLFFVAAVLAMLVISAFVLTHAAAFGSGVAN